MWNSQKHIHYELKALLNKAGVSPQAAETWCSAAKPCSAGRGSAAGGRDGGGRRVDWDGEAPAQGGPGQGDSIFDAGFPREAGWSVTDKQWL